MEFAVPTVIALLALVAWRLVFAGIQGRTQLEEITRPQQEQDNVLEQRVRPYMRVIAGGGWNAGSYGIDLIGAESRSDSYLRRIVTLVGATKRGNSYVLDVGTKRFLVRDRSVRRMRNASDPKCGYEETCFYSGFQGMPKGEQIACALMQLRRNPQLFDRWMIQRDIAFKADGQLFDRVR
jgi:hypothetical protein